MVQITTLAVLFLSATSSVLAGSRRAAHHRKRASVCRPKSTSTATATPTILPDTYNTTRIATVTKTTSATAKPTQDSDDDNGSDDGGDANPSGNALFPVLPVKSGWTVVQGENIDNVKTVKFNDDTFIITKKTPTTIWDVGSYEGKTAAKTTFNKGSITPGKQPAGGFSFYTPGPEGSSSKSPLLDLSKANELLFSYSVMFQDGFDFQLGGKMPGLYGGTNDDVAATCSGGRHDPSCWSARLMFRPKGQGELYLYIPPGVNDNDNKCGKSGKSKCHTEYGYSIGTGLWDWTPGKWVTVSQRILLNTPGKADGEAEVYVGGKSVLKVSSITWRTKEAAVTRGIQMQTFFGGHTAEWASPKKQDAYFADFSVGILN